MSAVARKTAVIVLAAHRKRVVSHEYTMTNIGYALLSGVCMKIDIRISIVCPCNSWRLSAFVIQNSIAVLAAQLKHLVLNKDSVMNVVCITTNFHISVICLRGLFVKRCCNTERHHRPRSAPETRGIPRVHHDEKWVCNALLSGVRTKIDSHIYIVRPCNSWRLSAFVIQNSIAVLAAQLKHLV